jgi:hypothetical protein
VSELRYRDDLDRSLTDGSRCRGRCGRPAWHGGAAASRSGIRDSRSDRPGWQSRPVTPRPTITAGFGATHPDGTTRRQLGSGQVHPVQR